MENVFPFGGVNVTKFSLMLNKNKNKKEFCDIKSQKVISQNKLHVK